MIKLSTIRALSFAMTLGVVGSAAHAQESINVKLSYNQPASSAAWREVMQPYADRLESLSDGRLKVTTYPGEVLHTVADGFRAAATGVTDVTSGWPSYQARSFKLFHAVHLPGALPTSDIAAVRVMDEIYGPYLKDEYEHLGVRLAFNALTPAYDILSKQPIRSLDDLKGMRIRAAGGIPSEIVERLGAIPVTMPITDAYTAFQQGVVDGVMLGTADMVAYRFHEVAKYNYMLGINRFAIPHAISTRFYDGLSDDMKAVFAQAGDVAGYEYAQMYMRLTEHALKTMHEDGLTIIEASDEDRRRIDELLTPMWGEFVEQNGGEGSVAAKLVEDLRTATARYEQMSDEEILALNSAEPVTGLR